MRNHLKRLRTVLEHQGLDGFLIPMADPFQNEIVSDHYNRLQFVSGFTGSAGFLVVLQEKAALFVDGRYTVQAPQEVDESVLEIYDYSYATIKKFLGEGLRVGFDPWTLTVREQKLIHSPAIELVEVQENLVDHIWDERPEIPWAPLVCHEEKFAGESSKAKRQRLGAKIEGQNLDAFLLTKGDSIAWLLNVRGGDVSHTPLPFAYAILHKTGCVDLFVDQKKVSPAVQRFLDADVTVYGLDDVTERLDSLAKVGVDPACTPVALVTKHVVDGEDPTLLARACKNDVEQEGMRHCHVLDGLALTKFLHFLEHHQTGSIDEQEASTILASFREGGEHYQGPSFETISAAGPNGATCHYRTTDKTNRMLEEGALYLVDSGGQYLNGTTDVTRTVLIGKKATDKQREHYTRVLKGHIAITSIRFPKGTTGPHLDVLARQSLWEVGLDYAHGTGHGVGSYLCVHEGPQGISPRSRPVPLMPGMVLSNEPGYYLEGEYGIRLENLVMVVESKEYEGFLEFENLTWAPFDQRLIDGSLLTDKEKAWLREYRETLCEKIGLSLDEGIRSWLLS